MDREHVEHFYFLAFDLDNTRRVCLQITFK